MPDTADPRLLDVRDVPPAQRHPLIFNTFHALAPGESFVGNFLRLLGEPARLAEVHFLEPIAPGDAGGRRRIAEAARERIVAALDAPA